MRKLKEGETFAAVVMSLIAEVMEDKKYRMSTFEILGYGYTEITLKMIYYDCDEYYTWQLYGDKIKMHFRYGKDRDLDIQEFGNKYEDLIKENIE